MAPLPPLTILDPYAWERSSVNRLALSDLVSAGQLAANEEGRPAEWIVLPAGDHAPNPPEGYVVSFTRFHERGFAAPASRFMGHSATATAWSCTTSSRMRFHRRPRSWASARGI
jgi:hypothetical protein